MSRFPWRDTSEDIASQAIPQYETPGGAQEKADKAEQNAKDYADDKLEEHVGKGGVNQHPLVVSNGAAGFMSGDDKRKLNAIQEGANNYVHPLTHPPVIIAQDANNRFVTDAEKLAWNDKASAALATTTSKGLMSAADFVKLLSIQAGAEVNQNAFAIVNDVVAASKAGKLTVTGGTGITVSTNPTTGEVRVTATGSAAPGPHAETHMEGGADELPHVIFKVHEQEVHGLRATNGYLEFYNGSEWRRVSGGGTPVGNVSDFTAAAANGKVTLKWGDPSDVVTEGITIARWAGTRILRKTGSYPANEDDGTLVVNNSVRDQYETTGFEDSGLTNGTTYYYMAFPYTDTDVFTIDPVNRVQAIPGAVPVGNVTNFSAAAGNAQILLKWGDPEDVVQDGVTVATWAGTRIVRKIGSYPINDNDGVVVVDSAVRDQYETVGFEDTGVINNTTYYYMAFPYTAEGVITIDEANRAQATPVSVLLGNVTDFAAKAGNAQITLSWGDPPDVSEGGIVVAAWAGTRIMRKVGSYPTSDTDGTLVVNSTVRDQYKVTGFTDTGLTNGTTYYYMAFPYTTGGAVTVDAANRVQATPAAFKVYGVEWDKTADTVMRIEDAAGLSRGDFDSLYPWSQMRRCNLSDSGVVNAYYGEPTYKVDGSNGQCMVEIPQFWYKKEIVGTKAIFYIADGPAPDYVLHPAFYRDRDGDGTAEEVTQRYYSTYEGAGSSLAEVTSVSGGAPRLSARIDQARDAAGGRGNGWGLPDFNLIYAVQLLYLIEYAALNSQVQIGMGVTSGSSVVAKGGTNANGNASSGSVSTTTPMSYRGIENLYGNTWTFVDGIVVKSGLNILVGNKGFAASGAGYDSYPAGISSAVPAGYISDILDTEELGFLPKTASGSATTKLTDMGTLNTTHTGETSILVIFGGNYESGTGSGIFSLLVQPPTGSSYDNKCNGRLAY